METVSLDTEQRKTARTILKEISAGEISLPTDVVDSWKTPGDSIDYSKDSREVREGEDFIDPAKIEGTFSSTIHRLESGRLAKILKWMIEEEFEVRNIYPPVVEKRGNRYYVSTDGHHRCIAAKAIGLERLYVEYEEIPPERLK